jgi:hypothetical protein
MRFGEAITVAQFSRLGGLRYACIRRALEEHGTLADAETAITGGRLAPPADVGTLRVDGASLRNRYK